MFRKYIIIFSILIVCSFGCSRSNEATAKIVDEHAKPMEIVGNFFEKEEDAMELLQGSIELPMYAAEHEYPTPIGFAHEKAYFNIGIKKNVEDFGYDYAKFAFYDINQNKYTIIKEAKNDEGFSSFAYIASTEEYVVFTEQNANVTDVYVYGFASGSLEKIHTAEEFQIDNGIVIGENVYSVIYENIGSTQAPSVCCIDLKNKKLQKIISDDSEIVEIVPSGQDDDCILIRKKVEQEQALIQYIESYNTKTETSEVLYKTDFGVIDFNAIKDFLIVSTGTKFWLYDITTEEKYTVTDTECFSPIKSVNEYVLWGEANDTEFGRPKYVLADIEKRILYDYNDSVVLLSEEGILWFRYNKDETEIAKYTVFLDGNTSMMYKKFDK